MLLYQYTIYKIYRKLIIPLQNPDGKRTCLSVFPENTDFITVFKRMKIRQSYIRYVFVPLVTKLYFHRLTSDYKTKLKSLKLYPVTGFFGDYSKIPNFNFYLDYSGVLQSLIDRFKIYNYRSAISLRRIQSLVETLSSVPAETYERVLLYTVCVDDTITPIIMDRKFYPIYYQILQWNNGKISDLPFDKVVLFVFAKDSADGKFVLIFDKKSNKNQITRLRNILVNLKQIVKMTTDDLDTLKDEESDDTKLTDDELENVANSAIYRSTVIKPDEKTDDIVQKLKISVMNYLKTDPDAAQEYLNVLNTQIDDLDNVDTLEDTEDETQEESLLTKKKPELKVEDKVTRSNVLNNFTVKSKVKTPYTKDLDIKQPIVSRDNVVRDFTPKLTAHKEVIKKVDDKINKKSNELVLASVFHSTTQNKKLSDETSKIIAFKKDYSDTVKEKGVVKDIAQKLLVPKEESKSTANVTVVKEAKPETFLKYTNPSQILFKRKLDYENLTNVIVEMFKVLEHKKYPLVLERIKKVEKEPSVSVLNRTDLVTYDVVLRGYKGKKIIVKFDLPKMDEHGFFTLYGKKRIIVNQLVTNPIFFFKPYTGSFLSSYSMITVYSKTTVRGSFLYIHMAGEKYPLLLILCLKEKFSKVLKDYGVTVSLKGKIDPNTLTPNDIVLKLSTNKNLVFTCNTEEGRQLVNAFSICKKYFKNFKFEDEDELIKLLDSTNFWEEAVINYVGNRNILFVIDQIWKNIVMLTEENVLKSKGLPYKLYDIIRYISSKLVTGYVDDRNSLSNQRCRTFEIIANLLLKQILAAYNEYENNIEMGSSDPQFKFTRTKVLTDIVTSQNIQLVENINPLEELAVKTRITPVGIGGIANAEEMPNSALNIHPTYYGNIDPLETPDGPNIGIQQHLSLGASMDSAYGSFIVKDPDQIDPTEILSVGPASIPFVESNEGARVTMASGQAKQALPLLNPEIPAIQSGAESIFTRYLSDSFVKISDYDGVVKEITDKYIVIEDTDKVKRVIDISDRELRSGQGKNGLSVFKPVVKEGDKVKKGDLIAEGANIKNGIISNGINVLVAYMPWKGFNFEDGMVVSEELVEKFTSVHNEYEEVILSKDDDVVVMSKIGDSLKKGSILIGYTKRKTDIESYQYLRTDGGIVDDIEVYSNIEEDKIPKLLLPAYEEFKKRYILLHNSYPIGKFKFREVEAIIPGILVRFNVKQQLVLRKGDKLNNRHFNKGVVAIIEKKENMPLTPWGEHVQMVYNPLAIINRMITGQILEMHTGLISRRLAILMEKTDKKKFIDILKNVMGLLDNTDGKIYSKNLISYFINLSDKGYKNVVEETVKNRFFPLIFPPFKSPKRENILQAMKFLGLSPRYKLYLPEYKIYTDPVSVGYVYVMKLEHMSEKKLHARGVGSYVSKTLTPVSGKKRGGGQQFGEYDLYSMLAWGSKYIVDEVQGPLSSDHVTKNEMISEIIRKGGCKFRPSRTNTVKDLFNCLMNAIHLVVED